MQGIVTVLNTPFTEDDRVDYDAIARHALIAAEAGVAGFLVPAMAAEVSQLRPGERDGMVRAVVEVLGCDIVLVSQPYETDDQYTVEIGEIASTVGLPVMVQDWDATGSGVPIPAIVSAFSAVDEFRYLKVETADAGRKYTALKIATDGSLHVSGGWAVSQLIEALDRGVDAFMPTALHPIYVGIFNRYRSGDRAAAVELFRKVLPILAFANQNLELSIHFFKRLLWRQGIYPTPLLRNPAHRLDGFQTQIADELIELAIGLEASVLRGRP
jgi:dihydrodipicolinate synthase/N-acetylneuraminate lyase